MLAYKISADEAIKALQQSLEASPGKNERVPVKDRNSNMY